MANIAKEKPPPERRRGIKINPQHRRAGSRQPLRWFPTIWGARVVQVGPQQVGKRDKTPQIWEWVLPEAAWYAEDECGENAERRPNSHNAERADGSGKQVDPSQTNWLLNSTFSIDWSFHPAKGFIPTITVATLVGSTLKGKIGTWAREIESRIIG